MFLTPLIFLTYLLFVSINTCQADFLSDNMRIHVPDHYKPIHKRLEPVIIHPIKKYDFTLEKSSFETSLKNYISDIDNLNLNQIIKEIYLSYGSVKTIKWEFNINNNQGILKVFSLNALITDNNIHLTGGSIILEQKIPYIAKQEQQCARTGERRYGVAGPRSLECNYYDIARALNGDELLSINQALMAKLPEAINRLSNI
jgi:hypothetical protein